MPVASIDMQSARTQPASQFRWTPPVDPRSLYARLQAAGLGDKVFDLDNLGFTVIEPDVWGGEKATPVIRQALLDVAESRTGERPDIEAGALKLFDEQHRGRLPFIFRKQLLLFSLIHEHPALVDLVLNPKINLLLEHCLGPRFNLYSCIAWFKKPDPVCYGDGLGMHKDSLVSNGAYLPGGKAHTVNFALLLTDYSKEDGGLAFIPGSHLAARQPRQGEEIEKAVAIDAPAGSIVLWHGDTWHGAYPKLTPGLRVTLTAMFCRPYVTPQEDFPKYAEKIDMDRYPARLKMLMGLANVAGSSSTYGPDFTGMEALYKQIEEEDGMTVQPVYHSKELY